MPAMFGRRPDGVLAKVHPYRRAMPFLMPGRNESAVYFEQVVDVTKTEAFVAAFNEAHPHTRISLFHVVLWAAVQTLHQRPRLNRFVIGSRVFDRDGIWISYSAKKSLDDEAPIVVLKRRFDPGQPFAEMVADLYAELHVGRSDARSTTDKELSLFLKLPGCGFRFALGLVRCLDRWGLLPRAFIDNDPFYASMFIANLGSLKMDAGYHHLYEYGNIPVFCVIGQTQELPVVEDGQVAVGRRAVLRFSYDERVEDGLYANRALEHMRSLVEDPQAHVALEPAEPA